MKKIIVSLFMLLPVSVAAQAVDEIVQLGQWLKTQQANAGISQSLHKDKYAVTWWDAISVGQSGLNVGKAGALDYVDLGPIMAVANGKNPRYGAALPIHVGNIWNNASKRLPPKIGSHVNLASIPNMIISPVFLWPDRKPINKWTWIEEFQIALAYRFGGS